MYLKRLEIFGFKSFAEKTVLNFEPGITAVVGPNGCGKSNIFDSMRWVLGEQSVKELRGAAMEDVIFNGTDSKPGLGFAEVSLTFSNESRMLPTEYDEVTVTRRLFRSGESEYLLNKTVVRLKDILELFMGTGVGAEAYSLVQQGKVDLIVSARPEDRRIIIDEAAGITKYKSKKREALNKLQDTDQNLLRINDIILEVKRQISSLERQANKARRYKEEFDRLQGMEIQFARHEIDQYGAKSGELRSLLENLKAEESRINEELESFNHIISRDNRSLEEVELKINDVRAQDIHLENDIELNNKQISFNDERTQGLHISDERLKLQIAQLQERCHMQQEKIESLQSALESLSKTMQTNQQVLAEKKESIVTIAHDIKTAKESIHSDEQGIMGLTSQQINIQNDMTEVMKEFQGFLARKRRLDVENEKVTTEKEDVDRRLSEVNANIEECLSKIAALKQDFDSKNTSVSQLKDSHVTLEKTIDDLENKVLALRSQKEFIEKLQVQYHDLTEPIIESTILASLPFEENRGIIGKIKQVRQVDGEKLGFIKEKFPQFQTNQLFEIICETKFIELDPQKINERITELSHEIDIHSRQKEDVQTQIKNHEDHISTLNINIHDLEKTLSGFETQRNSINEELNKLLSEIELVTVELLEAKAAMTQLKAKEDDLTQQLDKVNGKLAMLQGRIKERQLEISQWAQLREDATVVIAQLETEISLSLENEKTQRENLVMFESALIASQEEIQKLEGEIAGNQSRRSEIQNESESLRMVIEELRVKKNSLVEIVNALELKKEEINAGIEKVRQDASDLQRKIEEIRTQAHSQEMQSQQISFDEKSIKDRLQQAYKINFDELTFEPLPEGANIDQLAVDIEQLRKKCESFGSVNLVAIDEFDELKQRFEFLTKQQCDLITAKESLNQTIQKINRTTRQLFLDTFTKVSEEFRIYFRMLFGGGEAQLILVDPENVLESGIEIIARPPGKKLQNISLLSGGEKTLAAIALIFGVFKVRPSPFCILDEIDAALDESNVGRFSYLLKDFAKISQFIVITHNKKTIANADVMYGITMQQTGVSKIVSVKFGSSPEQEKKAEPVAVGA